MDDEVIRILIEIKQFTQSVRQIRELAKAVRELDGSTKSSTNNANSFNEAWKRAAASAKNPGASYKNHPHYKAWAAASSSAKTNSQFRADTINITANVVNVNGGRSSAGGSGNGGGGRSPDPNKTQSWRPQPFGRYSPAQRMQRQMMRLRSAIRSGDPNAIFDAQYGAHMLHQRVQQAKNFMNPMSIQARNIQNSLAPYRAFSSAISEIGQTFAPLVAAVTATVVAIGLMTKAAIDASSAMMKIGLTAGGTGAQTAQLSILGNVLGADMGELSRKFADEISKGGAASGFAAQAGIFHHGTFDTTNVAQKLLAWMKYLDTLSPEEAMRRARTTGTEALLPYRSLSKQTKNTLDMDANVRSTVIDSKTQKDMLEMQVAFARIQEAGVNVAVALVKIFNSTYDVTGMLNRFADELNIAALQLTVWNDYVRAATAQLNNGSADEKLQIASDLIKDQMNLTNAQNGRDEKHKTSLDQNTDALHRNTDAMAQRNGTYGGGERARGAIPPKWDGVNSERWLGEARRLGAFNL